MDGGVLQEVPGRANGRAGLLGWCLPRDRWSKECCALGSGRLGQKAL